MAFASQCPLGVMQGRLLPKLNGRYQAHPLGYWEDEFPLAAELGLELIEFIFDYNDYEKNPLYSLEGIKSIETLSQRYAVSVKTVCADYFMEAPLHSQEKVIRKKSLDVLEKLIDCTSDLGVNDLVIPCVDQSSLNTKQDMDCFTNQLKDILPKAEEKKVNLSLETDLDPVAFVKLIETVDHPCLKVNYDIGNSASLGYDVLVEFDMYGKHISDIHIKDRPYQGASVMLGTGDADFRSAFTAIEELNYQGPLIMQAYRDDEGCQVFKQQLEWVREFVGHIND